MYLLRVAVVVVLTSVLCGCAADEAPRGRLGSLPFPGLMTLYQSAEVSELGEHHYREWWNRPFEEEGARGIMYTCRAGFIDLAHLRESVDWSWYLARRVRGAIERGGGVVAFENDRTSFELGVTLPAWWDELVEDERETLAAEASIRIGARAAYDLAIWHEIATWYGWRTVFFVSEEGSAFTCDDLTSNLLGSIIGADVARAGDDGFDRRATEEIRRRVTELGPLDRSQVDETARRVETHWWRDGVAVRRDLDTGIASGIKRPWLADGAIAEEPAAFEVPDLSDVHGRDLRGIYQLRVRPGTEMIRRVCGDQVEGEYLEAGQDFARAIEVIRVQMREKWGSSADRPEAGGWAVHREAAEIHQEIP